MRTVYRASRVHTLSYPSTGEWILVDDRHVQRVGTGDPPEADRIVELPGATIIPGFVDSHVHLTGTGIHLQAPDLGTATSAEDLMRIVGRVVEVHDLLADDEHRVALLAGMAERAGERIEQKVVHVFPLNADGKVTDWWNFWEDQEAVDDLLA